MEELLEDVKKIYPEAKLKEYSCGKIIFGSNEDWFNIYKEGSTFIITLEEKKSKDKTKILTVLKAIKACEEGN